MVFEENSLTLWTILCMFPAKSIVSSSISSECTFFQTLDDHVTHPVLFIPETHISSLQRMVGLALRNFSLLNSWVSHDSNPCIPAGMRQARRGKTGGNVFSGKSGLGRGGYSVSTFKQQRSDELIGVETRHMCMLLQLLTPSFGYGGSCEGRHAPGAHRHLTHTNMRHPHPPTLLKHAREGENSQAGVLFRQAGVPTAWSVTSLRKCGKDAPSLPFHAREDKNNKLMMHQFSVWL